MIRDAKGLTEAEYLELYKTKNYPRPALTADVVIIDPNRMQVLLIRRGGHPFLGCYAFPGGFANADECIEETAARELFEETGLRNLELTPVGLYSKPGRDPRGWVVSQVYLALVDASSCRPVAGDDASSAEWFSIRKEGESTILINESNRICLFNKTYDDSSSVRYRRLAFDHDIILTNVLEHFIHS